MRYVEIEIISAASSIAQVVQPTISTPCQIISITPQPVESSSSTSNASVVLSPIPGPSNEILENDKETQELKKLRQEAMKECTDAVAYASHCCDTNCQLPSCQNMKNLLRHYQLCSQLELVNKKCTTCKKLFAVFQNHAKQCTTTFKCPVLLCSVLKQTLRLAGTLIPTNQPLEQSQSTESDSSSNPLVVVSPIPGPSNQQSQGDKEIHEAKRRQEAMQNCTDVLAHTSRCSNAKCQLTSCESMKNLLRHYQSCSLLEQVNKKCTICKKLFAVFRNHAKQCTDPSNCPVLLCAYFKQKFLLADHLTLGQTPPINASYQPQEQNQHNSLDLAIKRIFETLLSSEWTPEVQQRIFQIMVTHPQLVKAFNSHRISLQDQLNQQHTDLSDEQKKLMFYQIQVVDRVFSVFQPTSSATPSSSSSSQVSGTKSSTVQPAPRSNSYQLCYLCSLPSLNESQMSLFLQLTSDKTVDFNYRCFNRFPPLSLLLRYNQSNSLIPCLKFLLQHEEINLEEMFTYGHNALTLVCRYNSTESLIDCIKLLIQRGINMHNGDGSCRNALLLVCEFYRGEKMMELLQLLIQNGSDVLQQNNQAENALYLLCCHYKRGDLIDLIRFLISRGVKLDCKNLRKQTALHSLCQNYSRTDLFPILKLLVHHGIDATAEDVDEESALTLVCRYYRKPNLLEIIRFLVIGCGLSANKVEVDLCHSALGILCFYQPMRNHLMDSIRFFIEQGVNVAATDEDGNNILHILCAQIKGKKLLEVLRLLIEMTQVDVNAVNHGELKPLDIFFQQKQVVGFTSEITQLLTR